jgi:hypothetical protein
LIELKSVEQIDVNDEESSLVEDDAKTNDPS